MSNLRDKFWEAVSKIRFTFSKTKECESCKTPFQHNSLYHTIHYMAYDENKQRQDVFKMKVCDHCAMGLELVEKLQGEARRRE